MRWRVPPVGDSGLWRILKSQSDASRARSRPDLQLVERHTFSSTVRKPRGPSVRARLATKKKDELRLGRAIESLPQRRVCVASDGARLRWPPEQDAAGSKRGAWQNRTSAPSSAAIATSRPVESLPRLHADSAGRSVISRTCCVSARPSSQGCRVRDGCQREAPFAQTAVIRTTSACALATPAATPHADLATSFTGVRARGLTLFSRRSTRQISTNRCRDAEAAS